MKFMLESSRRALRIFRFSITPNANNEMATRKNAPWPADVSAEKNLGKS